MKQLDIEQNTPEWMEARAKYRTASEAAIVMGISPFQTPEQFKLIKAGLKRQHYSAAMKRGHDLEDQVRDWVSKLLGMNFVPECWVNGDYMASLDGIDGNVLVEIKVSDHSYKQVSDGLIPEHYWVQMQQQMYCSPATVGYLVVYSPKADDYAISAPVEEDPTAMIRVKDAWYAFDELPVPDKIDYSDDGEIVELFNEYEYLTTQLDAIKSDMDSIKQRLIDLSNDHPIEARGFKLTKSKPRVSYDYKKAAADAQLDLEPYKKQGEPSWSIRVPKGPFTPEE